MVSDKRQRNRMRQTIGEKERQRNKDRKDLLQTDKSGCFMCHGYFSFISSLVALFIALWFDTSKSMLLDLPHAWCRSLSRFSLSISCFFLFNITHTHTIHLLTVLHKSNVNFQFSFRRMSKGETFLFPILTGKVKHNRRNKSDCTKTTREKKIPCFECVSHLFYDYYDLSVEWIERSSIKKQNIGGRFWWFEHSYV